MNSPPADKILLVDDDPLLLASFKRTYRHLFAFDTAESGREALKMIDGHGPYAVIVADISMPLMSGIELLEAVHEFSPETVGIILTGNVDQQSAMDAVNRAGVFRFLCKPCATETLAAAIVAALQQSETRRIEHHLLHRTAGGGSVILLAPAILKLAGEVIDRQRAVEDCWKPKVGAARSTTAWEV